MPCDCLPQIKAQLQEKHGATVELKTLDVFLNVGDINNKWEGVSFPGVLDYTYQLKKQDGSPSKMKQKSQVYFRLCPFCGTPYREPSPPASSVEDA